MDFKLRLKEEISYQDILLKELADKAGISKRTLESYVDARGRTPGVDVAVRIAQALGVTVEYLVTGKNSSVSNEMSNFYSSYAKYSVFLEYFSELTGEQIEDMEAMVIGLVQKNREKKEKTASAG